MANVSIVSSTKIAHCYMWFRVWAALSMHLASFDSCITVYMISGLEYGLL